MSGARSQVKDAAVSGALVVAATVAYYLIPVPARMSEPEWAAVFGCGAAALAALIGFAIRRVLRTASEQSRVRRLVLLLVLTVLFFSWADRSVVQIPGQFVDLHTKTDALYFNVSTIATVGFGDVHPVGQLARAAVTLQIVFNLVILGTTVSVITGFMRVRARGRMPAPGAEPGPPADGEPG
jgi:voltage-gated potassium channel